MRPGLESKEERSEVSQASDSPAKNKIEKELLNKGFDRSQEESLHSIAIPDQLEEERKKELENAGRRLKLKMIREQR